MKYNIYISAHLGTYNLFGVSKDQIDIIKNAYLLGENNFTISGKTCHFENVNSLQIFQHDSQKDPSVLSSYYLGNVNYRKKGLFNTYLPESTLMLMGKNVTEDIIGNSRYGERKMDYNSNSNSSYVNPPFINSNRLNQLRNINSNDFDVTKLIKLCEEINDNNQRGNYMAVGMIGRTLLNHVPPIFGLNNFDEIANNYGGSKNSSFKKSMANLNLSLKNIADSYLHLQIRKKESLPNETQVDFKQDIDVLLAEIIRLL